MESGKFKRIIPAVAFILFLLPIATSSLLDLEQKRTNEIMLEQERAQRKAEENTQKKIYLTGKFDPAKREDFAIVPAEFNIAGYQMYLREEALAAFLKIQEAAREAGVDLKIISATRNFDYQKDLWEKKWTGATIVDDKNLSPALPDGLDRFKKILEYSAAPGASRHHWGTEIDINNANPEYFNTEKGAREYIWLLENAPRFGFCQTYNMKGHSRPTGYNEEKWHWSYLPLSRGLLQEYKKLVKNEDIRDFLGDEYAPALNLINDYVLSINPECL